METPAENKKTPVLSNKVVVVVAAVIVVVVIVATVLLLNGRSNESDGGVIGYATDAKVMLDQESLQAAMDEAMKNANDGFVEIRE